MLHSVNPSNSEAEARWHSERSIPTWPTKTLSQTKQKKQGVDLEFYAYLWFGFYLISENSIIMFFDEGILK